MEPIPEATAGEPNELPDTNDFEGPSTPALNQGDRQMLTEAFMKLLETDFIDEQTRAYATNLSETAAKLVSLYANHYRKALNADARENFARSNNDYDQDSHSNDGFDYDYDYDYDYDDEAIRADNLKKTTRARPDRY